MWQRLCQWSEIRCRRFWVRNVLTGSIHSWCFTIKFTTRAQDQSWILWIFKWNHNGSKHSTHRVVIIRKEQKSNNYGKTGVFLSTHQEIHTLTGRGYWVVERWGRGGGVAVAYKNISRTGSLDQCGFGRNVILSFYSISKSVTLLHRVQTTFTQPLHAGLCLEYSYRDTAEFCTLK